MNNKEIEIDFSDQIKAANEGKTLNKPFRTPKGPKKFSVYVKNEKGNVVKVNFGDPNMEIKRDDPARRKALELDIIAIIRGQNIKHVIGRAASGEEARK